MRITKYRLTDILYIFKVSYNITCPITLIMFYDMYNHYKL